MTYRQLKLAAARSRRYREQYPERKRAANAKYYANHTETCKRAVRVWNKLNHKARALQASYRRKGLPVLKIAELRARGLCP